MHPNIYGTVPQPVPGATPPGALTTPAPGWFSENAVVEWAGTAAGNTNTTSAQRHAIWMSPVFDLRPEYKGVPASTFAPQDSGQRPVWRPYGMYGRLFVEMIITRASGTITNGLNITAVSYAHPWDPNSLRVVSPEQDVSQTFLSTNTPRRTTESVNTNSPEAQLVLGGAGTFNAPGGSTGPIRFWQQVIIIRNWKAAVGDPQIVISSGYY